MLSRTSRFVKRARKNTRGSTKRFFPRANGFIRDNDSHLGPQGLEIEHEDQMYHDVFFQLDKPILTGPFGTPNNPVKVPSVFPSRIVGCYGDPRTELVDEPLWHFVRKEKPTVCLDCGQVFELVLPEGYKELTRGHH
eukprot:TRINITY_DN2237_c0_g1_i1.p1 TRINITY_DN2237_c0_g1~~TRINITY_DN2237_c0_g1_i1.p1  ORF type:complete len:137 (-),score=26.15 TRINITY_DN2237_c0_g1_i1:67-477(-)